MDIEGRSKKVNSNGEKIVNPVLRGFHPDPSVIRVGEDYYIATSTFEWWPGVRLHHSRDLKNWELIGYPLDRVSQLDLRGVGASQGVWAPCLTYDKGTFYLVYTIVRAFYCNMYDTENYLVTAQDIHGPWSEPVALNNFGFDPSLFHDEDGRKYMVSMVTDHRVPKKYAGRLVLQEYDPVKREMTGPVRDIFKADKIFLEGPHIFRRKDWYYLFAADTGTGEAHGQTILRSKSVWGPYEMFQADFMERENEREAYSILTSRHREDILLQKCGHCDLVETPDGEWYAVHLCGRASKDRNPEDAKRFAGSRRYMIGRETAIQKMRWTKDGWLVLEAGGNMPQTEVEMPVRMRNAGGETAGLKAGGPEAAGLETEVPERDESGVRGEKGQKAGEETGMGRRSSRLVSEVECRITEYGAVGDNLTINTTAVQRAIDCCHEAGGGTVRIEKGIYLCGTIFLRSNVTLDIGAGGVLKASPNIEDYREDVHHNRYRNEAALDRCFLYAEEQENLCITGRGRIDGSGECFPNAGSEYRPMMMRFLRCKGIRVEGIFLFNAAAWTTAFLDSSYIWVNGVTIFNDRQYNGDGLDFDGCSHVFVDNCSITGTDDNLCLQAGSKKFPVEDIHIVNCEFSSVCAGIRIGLKSVGNIRNVVISNCTMKRVWREGIKIECTEGGSISEITVDNVVMRDVRRPLFVLLNNRFEPEDYGSSVELTKMPEIGTMENLMFSNMIAVDSEEMERVHYRFGDDVMGEPKFNGIRVDANRDHPIRSLTIRNLRYHSIGGVKRQEIPEKYPKVPDKRRRQDGGDREASENYYPDWSRAAYMDVRSVKGLYLSNLQFSSENEDERPACVIEDCLVWKKEIIYR